MLVQGHWDLGNGAALSSFLRAGEIFRMPDGSHTYYLRRRWNSRVHRALVDKSPSRHLRLEGTKRTYNSFRNAVNGKNTRTGGGRVH